MAKTALVTGASGGIGLELARLFAKDGYDVVLVARSAERLGEVADELEEQYHVRAFPCPCDLSDTDGAASVVKAVDALDVQVDALVNNAGFAYDAPFAGSDAARQRDLVQVDVVALMELSHEFGSRMAARGEGRILNVASIAGFMPGPYMATYYASKAFVQSFTQALHVELKWRGVHVTALCPGPVRTSFWKAADAEHVALTFLMARPQRVARAGYRALAWNKTLCFPGLLAKAAVFVTRLVPRCVMSYAVALLQRPKFAKK